MEALKTGLTPFISREFTNYYKGRRVHELEKIMRWPVEDRERPFYGLDSRALLRVMWESWNEVFRNKLGQTERSLVSELQQVGNRWAHEEAFSNDDTYRALDSAHRFLISISAPEADQLRIMKTKLQRKMFSNIEDTVVPSSEAGRSAGPNQTSKPSKGTRLYHVYTDQPTRKSTIHMETCRWFLGRRSSLRSDNWWHGPYMTKAEAMSSNMNVGTVRECGTCHP